MGYIKEPKGVDFIIKSDPLTDDERKAISAFIKSDKAKNLATQSVKKSSKKIKKAIA